MQDSKSRQVSIHITINLTKGYFSNPTHYLGFSVNNCDPITTNNLALDEDSNLIRITNQNGSPKLFRIP